MRDHQTSRSFHMERDVRAEASVSYFIEFLEQRALAMENADTASASVRRQGAVVNAVAVTQAHQGCHYCAATEQPAGTGPPINIPGVAAKSPGMPGVI
ncbi:uncharacterized protein [Epargyreus clarus]|uniref:uncharacterized protein n=1 Tax=Epargyreus clarus TaxID=520877 RepID=UPI003C2B1D91